MSLDFFKQSIELPREKGALYRVASGEGSTLSGCLGRREHSIGLTCRPLKRCSFNLTKAECWDGLCLRYGWVPPRLPASRVCVVQSLQFAMRYPAHVEPSPPSDIMKSEISPQ